MARRLKTDTVSQVESVVYYWLVENIGVTVANEWLDSHPIMGTSLQKFHTT